MVRIMQKKDRITPGLEKSPMDTMVVSGAASTIMPAFWRPMNIMKQPIPAVMPNLRLGGIWSRTLFLTPLTAMAKNMIPDIRTATRACCHVNPIVMTMV